MVRAGTNFAATSRWANFGASAAAASLQFAGEGKIAFQPAFLPLNLFIQPRVFEGDGNLRRERRHGALVLFGKESAPRVFQVEHPNDFVFVDQRDGQLRARLRIGLDIASIFGNIGHQHSLLTLRPRPPCRAPRGISCFR